jgi:hypothetical protein
MIFYDFKMIAEEENRVTYETNNIAKQILFAGFRFKPKKQTFPFFTIVIGHKKTRKMM